MALPLPNLAFSVFTVLYPPAACSLIFMHSPVLSNPHGPQTVRGQMQDKNGYQQPCLSSSKSHMEQLTHGYGHALCSVLRVSPRSGHMCPLPTPARHIPLCALGLTL